MNPHGAKETGTPYGRYRLQKLIGRGGMGEVCQAFDTVTDRLVAMKVLPAHISIDLMFQQRFRREAHAAAKLKNYCCHTETTSENGVNPPFTRFGRSPWRSLLGPLSRRGRLLRDRVDLEVRRRGKFPSVGEDRVRVEIGASGVATVTMVRADKHNALDQAMFEGLMDAAGQLAGDASVRAVVLHGEGKSFCSGLDIASFMSGQGGTGVLLERDGDRLANFAQRVTYDWSLVPAPVIAAIHGNCFGGGLQIALGADIRIASPDAKLSIMEIKWGLVPDMAITQTLPRLVRIDVAKELTFSGRIISGSDALALGLVTRNSDDPRVSALVLAEEIAQKSPDAVRAAKRLYDETWVSDDAAAALKRESDLQTGLIGKPNQLAAVVAGMSGEPPVFVDPE